MFDLSRCLEIVLPDVQRALMRGFTVLEVQLGGSNCCGIASEEHRVELKFCLIYCGCTYVHRGVVASCVCGEQMHLIKLFGQAGAVHIDMFRNVFVGVPHCVQSSGGKVVQPFVEHFASEPANSALSAVRIVEAVEARASIKNCH